MDTVKLNKYFTPWLSLLMPLFTLPFFAFATVLDVIMGLLPQQRVKLINKSINWFAKLKLLFAGVYFLVVIFGQPKTNFVLQPIAYTLGFFTVLTFIFSMGVGISLIVLKFSKR